MLPPTSRFRETLGLWTGAILSPLFGIASAFREASAFHPRGICFIAQVTPARTLAPPLADLAKRLSGQALLRHSAGLWRQDHRLVPDLLGCAIRFRATQPWETITEVNQDLLLATARSPWTLALDSIKTNTRDFLANDYFAMAPFSVGDWSDCRLRLRPKPAQVPNALVSGRDRHERLRAAVARNEAAFLLEILCPELAADWQPLVEIQLQQEVAIDRETLRFNPFLNGQGLRPQGFIHYLRPLPYRVSQFSRSRVRSKDVAELESLAAELPSGLPGARRNTSQSVKRPRASGRDGNELPTPGAVTPKTISAVTPKTTSAKPRSTRLH